MSSRRDNQRPLSYVAETNGNNAEFWIYATGEQSAAIGLPPGLNGAAVVQLDGHAPVQVQVQNGALSVALGMKPGQDRIQPPPRWRARPHVIGRATNPPSEF